MKQLLKLFYITSILVLLVMYVSDAQSYKLKRWVFGSGGMVAETNSNGMKISGILGQLAIERISNAGFGTGYTVYQGFWVPDKDQGTSVTDIPAGASISNYPNPFSSSTTIEYTLPGLSLVNLNIYDVSGKKVYSIELGIKEGTNRIDWNAKDMSGVDLGSGSYIVELSVEPASISGVTFNPFTLRNVMILVR